MPQSVNTNDAPLTVGAFISFYEKNIRTEFSHLSGQIELIGRQLVEQNDRFDFLFKKYETFEQELTIINHQLKRIDARLDGTDARLDAMDERFDRIDARLEGIDTRLNGMESGFKSFDQRLSMVEATLVRHGKELKELKAGFSKLEKQQILLLEAVRVKKQNLGHGGPTQKELARDIDLLKKEAGQLNQRLSVLESQIKK